MLAIAAYFVVLASQLLLTKSGSPDCLQTPYTNGLCNKPPKLAWSYHVEKGTCLRFLYTGCSSSSGNVFPTKEKCERECDRYARVHTKLSGHHKVKRSVAAPNGSGLGLTKFCFQRYNLVQLDQCKLSRMHAWYYDRGSSSCQQYEVCALEDLVYKNRYECMQRCVPLYKGIMDMALQQEVESKAKGINNYAEMESNKGQKEALITRATKQQTPNRDFHEWLNKEIERRMKSRSAA